LPSSLASARQDAPRVLGRQAAGRAEQRYIVVAERERERDSRFGGHGSNGVGGLRSQTSGQCAHALSIGEA
jgi:hypothetical protein